MDLETQLINKITNLGGTVKITDEIEGTIDNLQFMVFRTSAFEIEKISKIIDNVKLEFRNILIQNMFIPNIDLFLKYVSGYYYHNGNIVLSYSLNNSDFMIAFLKTRHYSSDTNTYVDINTIMHFSNIIERFHYFQLGCLNSLPPNIMRVIFKYSLADTVFE